MPRKWTDEERTHALNVYQLEGPSEAARQTGIPKDTIASWARRDGLHTVCAESKAARIVAARLSWEERRVKMVHELGRIAAKALAVADANLDDGDNRDAQSATTTAAICIDKAQLLSGEASVRVEHRHVDAVDAELQDLVGELEREP